MSLLNTIKKIVYLAPVRCGRTFYGVEITENNDNISIAFTPTDEYLLLDPRREFEEFMPNHIHAFEKWQHIGLIIGSLEYFLNENTIEYSYIKNPTNVLLTLSKTDKELIGISKQEKLKHAHRTFNSDVEVDVETMYVVNKLVDDFLIEHTGHKIVVTDSALRKKVSALALYWETEGDTNPSERPPQMVTAPTLLCIPPKEYDLDYYFDMGRLYAEIGLVVLSRGYQLAYCNAFNLFDPRAKLIEDTLCIEYDSYTKDNVPPRPWICIGKALDPSKPHNWVTGDRYAHNNNLMITCILTSKDYVKVNELEHV
jgi:hypothetical protein